MPTTTLIVPRPRMAALILTLACAAAALPACDDSAEPAPAPTGIEIVSGDAQYTKNSTELEAPVRVRVRLDDGSDAAGAAVRFQVIEGGGSLSRASAKTSGRGETSVRWTMGPATGPNRLRISLADDVSISVVASATSADFYCPEEDPTFVRKFSNAHNLYLVSRSAGILESAGTPNAGVARLELSGLTFLATVFLRLDEGFITNVVRDCAFSVNGDCYLVRNSNGDEIAKLAPDGTWSHFASLESFYGTEIETTPAGILVGCDDFGPFAVTCRDTLFRWEGAVYGGLDVYPDAANNDAVAVDPTNDDLYFIYLGDRSLYRLPLDGLNLTSPPEKVVTLARAEADGATGMVVDERGGTISIFILVESAAEKAILKVTPAGVKTTEYDFFSRGAGDAAGVQDDLAIDRTFHFLYTLDTKNDVILLYELIAQSLSELTSQVDPHDASNASSGERVGLAVLP